MGKIIVKKDLSLVCSAGNYGFPYDGVLKYKDDYYATCVHGDVDGTLALELHNRNISVCPNTIRPTLNTKLGLSLKNSDKVYIIPCFPIEVRSRFGKDLSNNNIVVLCNNWKGITSVIYYDGNFVALDVKNQAKVTIFVGKHSELKSVANKQMLCHLMNIT